MFAKLLCLSFASIISFMFSLNGEFVFDDSEAIVKNKDITSESWLDPFKNDFWGTSIKSNLSHKSYRPLTILSYRLNYLLNKELSPLQFKATNLFCHVACCILIWMSYDCIWKRVKMRNVDKNCSVDVPFLAAILFSVLPVHVEAVCGAVGRADLLSAITFFVSFLIYDKAVQTKSMLNIYLFTSIILAGVSMLFKENGITVLGISCVYDLVINIKFRSKGRVKSRNKINNYINVHVDNKSIYRIACIILCAMILLYARWIVMGGTKPEFKPTDNPTAFSDDLFTKVATYNYIYFLNILLLIWPQWLCYDWSMGCVPLIRNILDYRIIFVLSFYLYGLFFIISIATKKSNYSIRRIELLAVSLMVIPFLPAANIVYPVGFVIAERILYIPSAGYCLLITIGLYKIKKKYNYYFKQVEVYFTCIICILALKSWRRSYDWQNEYQLYTNALNICPLNAKVHYNVAKVADAKYHADWALAEYKEAIRLYPEYYQAMNNLANLLKNQKKYKEAEHYLRISLHYKNDFPAAWMNLGIVLAHTGRYNDSQIAYKTALRYRKYYPDCFYNLGNLYLELNKTNLALENWFHAINLNPKHVSAWTNLLALLDNTGQIDKALQIIPKALEELPETPLIHFAIANIYGKIDEYNKAEKYFLKAINLFQNRVQAIHYANLGVLYHRWKKYDLATQMYQMALKIDSKFPSALKNLRNLERLKNKSN
nr:transmembrane and TPR repeat-containing protein 4-like isoform X1 [Vanessa tameamea]